MSLWIITIYTIHQIEEVNGIFISPTGSERASPNLPSPFRVPQPRGVDGVDGVDLRVPSCESRVEGRALATRRDVTREARPWRTERAGWSPRCLRNDLDSTSQKRLPLISVTATSSILREHQSCFQVRRNCKVSLKIWVKRCSGFWRG